MSQVLTAIRQIAHGAHERGRRGLPIYSFDIRDAYLQAHGVDDGRAPVGYCGWCRDGEVYVPGDAYCADCLAQSWQCDCGSFMLPAAICGCEDEEDKE